MATQLQIRRGTTAQMNAFTGAEGELAVNTSTDTVHVHDGSTAGGFALAKADGSNIGTYAGSFTTISASGAITGNVTGNLTGSVLTAAQTNITSVGTLSSLAVTGALTVDTNTLVVDATNNRVGIGTSSPRTLVNASSATGAILTLESSDTSLTTNGVIGGIDFYSNDSSTNGTGAKVNIRAIGQNSSGTATALTFGTSSSGSATAVEAFRADASGNLLVGITSAYTGGKLSVNGGIVQPSGAQNVIGVYGTSGLQVIGVTGGDNVIGTMGANEPLVLRTGSVERMRIDQNGWVNVNANIATDNPADSAGLHFGWNYSNAEGESLIVFNKGGGSVGGLLFSDNSANGTPAERMRIDSSGRLLVGLTGASGYGTVETDTLTTSGQCILARAGGNLLVGKTVTSVSTVGVLIQPSGNIVASPSTVDTYGLYASGNYKFYVGVNGTVYAVNTTISGISDVRYKENIRDLDDGLSKVMQLQPRKFDWKEGKGKDIANDRGFIAQEFEEVFPDLVSEWKDPAPEGEEPYKAVRADLIPTLVKAIQEQQATIESQAAAITDLTTRLTALENT